MRYNYRRHIDKARKDAFMASLRARNDPVHILSRITRTKREIASLIQQSGAGDRLENLRVLLQSLEAKHARVLSHQHIQSLAK